MFKSITLEVSLKPFYNTEEAAIRQVAHDIFMQWYPLLKKRERISVMLWTADGSEILDYAGSLSDSFEWAHYIGTANNELASESDPPYISPHIKKFEYRADPPVMTYKILKTIVTCLKEEGKKIFPLAEVQVGETFDIGPEFAVSDFKYGRHREICGKIVLDHFGFVDSTAMLEPDDYHYAAYPNGIPENTCFGTFLGKQSRVFCRDMGFDFLWLSNGLGFSADPWKVTGKIFDGENFYAEKLELTRKKVFDFWRTFREACPELPLQTRGTNNSVGIDYATDGVPLYDIYEGGFNILPPPNSPWAALNDDYGLEIMGHMTRVCRLPGRDFMFRFYIHDPWWMNSPWYDRYDGFAGDIYLPMAVARIDGEGKTQSAGIFNILSIDNSKGELPDSCVYEPLPHILKAEKNSPDEPGLFVWVYPMREYSTADGEKLLSEMYYGDNFIRGAINDGFPLNTVVSTDYFVLHDLSLYRKSILVSPLPETEAVAAKLREFESSGGKVIYYGSADRKAEFPEINNMLDSKGSPAALRAAAAELGVEIVHLCREGAVKPPAMTIARHDNGLFFSVYNADTTTKTQLRFPLGAPCLFGGETELKDGYANYSFIRSEHRECRVFVKQDRGVVSVHEAAPVSNYYRRRFTVRGLEDATVCVFPESYAVGKTDFSMAAELDSEGKYVWINSDITPIFDDSWELVHDPEWGDYYRAEHITGDRFVNMPFPQK